MSVKFSANSTEDIKLYRVMALKRFSAFNEAFVRMEVESRKAVITIFINSQYDSDIQIQCRRFRLRGQRAMRVLWVRAMHLHGQVSGRIWRISRISPRNPKLRFVAQNFAEIHYWRQGLNLPWIVISKALHHYGWRGSEKYLSRCYAQVHEEMQTEPMFPATSAITVRGVMNELGVTRNYLVAWNYRFMASSESERARFVYQWLQSSVLNAESASGIKLITSWYKNG